MIQHRLRHFVKALLPGGVAGGFHAHEHLELQFDGRKRVFEVVRHAPRHVRPGFVALHLRQTAGALAQIPHHAVIGLHQGRNFVLLVVFQRLQVVYVRYGHLPAQLRDGAEQPAHHFKGDKAGNHQEQQENGNDGGNVQDGLRFQVVGDVGEGGRYNGHHAAAAVHHRGVQGIVAAPARPFPVHVKALVAVHDLHVGGIVQPVSKNHAVVHFRGGAHDYAPGKVEEGDVALEVVPHAFHRRQNGRGTHLFRVFHLPQALLQHALQRIDARGHDAFHIGIVALVDKPDGEAGHGHQRDQERNVHHQADPRLVVAFFSAAVRPPGEDGQQEEGQDGKEEALHHIIQPFGAGAGKHNDFPFRHIVHKVAPAFQVYMRYGIAFQYFKAVRINGGVGIQALVLHQSAIHVFGPGVHRRQRHASRVRDAQQAQVAAVLAVVLGFHRHQHRVRALVLHIIGEQAGIGGASAAYCAVKEVGILAQPYAAPDAVLEKGGGAYVVRKLHGDVVVL